MAQVFDNDPLQEFVTKEVALSKIIGTPEETDFKRQRVAEQEAMPKYKSERLPYITYDDITTEGDMYDPLDFPTVSQKIRDNVLKAVVSRFPIQSEQYTVKVENPHYETPRNTRIKDERDAILQQKSISDRLRGDLVLIDNKTGKELQRRTLTLVNVPRMTDRGTFIRNGAFIAMKHMFRLRPGVYTRIKGNGIVQAHVNPKQGTGRQMSIELDPDSGVLNVHRAGRQYGLLPLLLAGGMPEDAIKSAWGDELYNMNKEKYKQLFVSGNKKMEDYKKLWDEELTPMLLDKETTQWTLGTPYESVQPAVLLKASNKILRIARNAGDPDAPDETDDRDGLQYQTVLGPADYIAERILRDGGGILRNTLNQITREGSLDKVQPGMFQPHVDSVFTEDKHTGYIDESSPLEVVYFNSGVSRLGEGGIGDTRAAPAESRGVQNSYVGFVDIIQSPECYDDQTEILSIKGWISVKDMTMDTLLACRSDDGNIIYAKPMHLTRIFYGGPVYKYHSELIILAVTPNHRMWVRPADEKEYRFMRADECAETPFLFVCDADGNEYELFTENWIVTQPAGYVYCPTVPGGIVYVRRYCSHGIWCGNSLKVGLDNYLTHGVRKDDKGKLYTKMRMPNGQVKYVDMATVANSVYTTPEYFDPKADPNERIPAFVRGKAIEWVPRSNVNMYVADTSSMMSKASGTVPLIGGIRSNRVLLGCLHPDTVVTIRYNGTVQNVNASFLLDTANSGSVELITDYTENGDYVWSPLRGVYEREITRGLYKIHTASGRDVIVNGAHKWYIRDMYEPTDGKLVTTDDPEFINAHVKCDGGLDFIESVTPVPESEWPEYLVDIDMNDSEYMLANGLFTHNSKYGIQAVPLVHREAPLVRRALPDDNGNPTTTERYLGKTLGARMSPVDGTVVSVDPDEIVIKGRDGQKHTIDLYNNYILNQKGFLQNIPQVKPGDKVAANQVIASSNYTDAEGNAALGTNLRMAFMTGKDAGTFEDAITIAESVAKTKMASMQMYKARGSITPDIEYNKDKFIRSFGRRDFTKEQLDKLGDDGVALEGTVLEKGDPIFVGVKTQDQSTRGIARNAVVPYVETWEHEYPGTVRTIAKGRKHFTAYIDAITPMETGDKMCFDNKTEVFTDAGWKHFCDLDRDDRILTLDPDSGSTYFTDFTAAYAFYHKGRMYSLVTPDLDICTTDNHRHLVARNCDCSYMKFMTSDEVIGKHVYHFVGMDADFGKPRFYKCSRVGGKSKEQWIQYDGYVYCLEVPYTHTLYVRRNGKSVWSGNSNRYGAKGVVRVVPDEQMPVDENGQMIEVLQSPLGLPSRINTAQVVEAQEGKIARLTGQPVELPDFMPNENLIDRTLRRLEEHGLKESETLYDPSTGKHIPDVETGVMFYYKMKHMADSKQGARSTGGYTVEEVPTKGGKEGCFIYDQYIETDQGCRKIGEIVERKESVNVRGYSKQNGWGWYPVVDWFKYSVPRDRIITVIAEVVSPHDESTYVELTATGNHEFYRADGTGILVKDIEPGMLLKTNSKRAVVTALKQTHGIHDYVNVYDIEVADVHNYVTHDVLVSNSRRLGGLEIGALLGGGGDELVRDAKLVRGQQNDEFWRSYMNGEIPDAPRTPLVHKKFFNHLKAAGVSIEPRGNKLHIYGASNNDIKNLTGARRVTNTSTFDSKQLRPVKGGLFDPSIFGADGDQWGYYELPEPVLNPLMFKPVAHMLGWKDKELEGLLRGERQVNGKVGIEALEDVLSKIDLPKELRIAKATLKDNTAPLSKRDAALKKVRAIEPMIREHKTPSDMLWTRLPILPPAYRQVNTLADDVNIVADANFLYKRVMDAADDLREAKQVLPKEALMDARTAVYDTLDELVGLSDTGDPKLQAKNVGGLLKWAFGKGSPKLSSLHRKVFGATVDLGGRGTVVSDNSLSIDQLGIPEKTAWKLYEPQVVRRLRQRGFPMLDAIRNVTERTPEARRILDDVMKDMPVLMNRAPTLWEYGIRGFYPVIVEGDTTHVNPNVVVPFNMDFDGNCVDYNTVIFLKSTLDNPILSYILEASTNQRKDASMITDNGKISISYKDDYVLVSMPIGEFPIKGSYVCDKNGAKVYNVPTGISVLSYDSSTGSHAWCPVTNFTIEEDCDTCELTVQDKSVIVSTNESVAVFDAATGSLKKVAPADTKDCRIPVFKQNPSPFGAYGTAGLGWLHGMFLSDGWTSFKQLGIAKMENVKRERFTELLASEIGGNFTVHDYAGDEFDGKLGDSCKRHFYGDAVATHFNSIAFYNEERTDNMDKRSALYKQIPSDLIAGGSESYLWGLFSGLLDGDGSITKNMSKAKPRFGARLSTSSKYLVDSVKSLCYRLGIRCSCTVTPARNGSNEAYTITFSTIDVWSNIDKLTCVGAHECAMLAEWKNNPPAPDKLDQIPISDTERKKVRDWFRVFNMNSAYVGIAQGRAARTELKKLFEKLPEDAKNELRALMNRTYADNVLWCTVDTVKNAGKRTVYDLVVDGTKVFVANNGIVVYDTAALHVPVTKQAIAKVKEKMLPSRSLLSPQFNQVHYAPAQEFLQGLNLATRKGTNKPVRFRSEEEMLAALKRGDITYDTEYIIG